MVVFVRMENEVGFDFYRQVDHRVRGNGSLFGGIEVV